MTDKIYVSDGENMKHKIMMILCAYAILLTRIIHDILKLVFLIGFCIPSLLLPFNNFSRVMDKIQESIDEIK